MTDAKSLTLPHSALPGDADRHGVAARFAKGVLELEFPRTANPLAQVKQIAIRAV